MNYYQLVVIMTKSQTFGLAVAACKLVFHLLLWWCQSVSQKISWLSFLLFVSDSGVALLHLLQPTIIFA